MSRRPDPSAGISLLELLMTVALTGIAMSSAVQLFSLQARKLQGNSFRTEAQQALRSTLDAIGRDLRLAGACLPVTGAYVALTGTDQTGPPGDSITIRTGVVRSNLSCIVAALTATMTTGTNTAQLDNPAGFIVNDLIYLRHPSGSGQYLFLTALSGTTATLSGSATVDYPPGSGFYNIDERSYAVDTSIPGTPRLMLTVNRGTPEAFAAGINDLELQYVLNRNCPPCDVVTAPAVTDTATWRLVNQLQVSATVQTVGTTRPEDVASLTQLTSVKPRNLLP